MSPLLSLEPATAGVGGDEDGRGSTFLALVGMASRASSPTSSACRRGRREAEPLELPE